MSILKDLYMEEYNRIIAEAEEAGLFIDSAFESKAGDLASVAANARLYEMCDEAKDRAKERRGL